MPTDQRQQLFARIKEALRVPAPHRHDDHRPQAPEAVLPESHQFSAWLPAVGSSREEQMGLFAKNSLGLKTDFQRCKNIDEAVERLQAMAKENEWKKIATHRTQPILATAQKLKLPTLVTDDGYAVDDLESCDASLTGCDALIAQTGSVLVSSSSAGGRALSVLPPHHVVLARENQMVPDLTVALHQAHERYAEKWPSFFSFITGPSRTGDIERILVLGAHGPKKLTVLLYGGS